MLPLYAHALAAANRDEMDFALIRREWAAVAQGEDDRTAWLEAELAAISDARLPHAIGHVFRGAAA